MVTDFRIGVGGWTFEPWRETFYPDKLRQADELSFMASRLNAVEVNGTFYRTQTPETFRNWAAAVPEDFRFALKAPRYATNRKVLAEAGESVTRFIDSGIAELGGKLGPLLWQFAPTKKFDADDFARFLDLLPPEAHGLRLRHAVEPRHETFRDPAFIDLCRERGIAVVLAADSEYPMIADRTADFAYLRIMGTQARYKAGYSPASLKDWTIRAQDIAAGEAAEGLAPVVAGTKPPAPESVYLFVISGEKRLNPLAAEAMLKRLRG